MQVFAGTGNWEQIYSWREQLDKQNYLEGGRPATCRRLTAHAEGGGFSYLIIHCCYITIHKKVMEWKNRAQRETPNIFYVKRSHVLTSTPHVCLYASVPSMNFPLYSAAFSFLQGPLTTCVFTASLSLISRPPPSLLSNPLILKALLRTLHGKVCQIISDMLHS